MLYESLEQKPTKSENLVSSFVKQHVLLSSVSFAFDTGGASLCVRRGCEALSDQMGLEIDMACLIVQVYDFASLPSCEALAIES